MTTTGPSWEVVSPENLRPADVVSLWGAIRVVVGRRTDGQWVLEDGDGNLTSTSEPEYLRLRGGWSP